MSVDPLSTPQMPYIDSGALVATETIYEPSENELRSYAILKANEYGVSFHEMSVTIGCESSWNPKAIGDSGRSRGLAQIHAPSWDDISDDQAFDPYFSIDFMAKKFSEGQQDLWTCWRQNFDDNR